MVKIVMLLGILGMISCSTNTKYPANKNNKLEIIKIDSADIYYIFNIKDENNSIIIGKKDHLKQCIPFKKYIIKNGVSHSPSILIGNEKVYVGALEFEIDDKKVKNGGEPIKYINNCRSFTD